MTRDTSTASAQRYQDAHARSYAVQAKKRHLCALIGAEAFSEDDVDAAMAVVDARLRDKLAAKAGGR